MTKNPNEYAVLGNIAYIFLCNREGKRVSYAMIDSKNLEKVLSHRWRLSSNGYAMTDLEAGKVLLMHQLILGFKEGVEIDHEEQDKLDNREAKLRFLTHSQNLHNSKLPVTNTSGYKNVYWTKRNRKWRARIKIREQSYHLGYFDNAEDAAVEVAVAKIKLIGGQTL